MSTLLLRMVHLWEKRDTPEGRQLIRYFMVSVISTIVSFGTLGIVFGVFHVWGEVGSTVFANVVATVPSYYLTRSWVWKKGGRSHLVKEILPFWLMSAAGIVVSIGGATAAKHIGTALNFHHGAQTVLVEVANVTSFAVFWVLKYLLYNRIFKVHPVEDLDDLVEAL